MRSRKASALARIIPLTGLLIGAAALAHDFWIEPETFHPALNAKVPLKLLVGMDFKGDAALYNPEQFEKYATIGPTGEQPVAGTLGDDPAGKVAITAPGLYTTVYYSKKFDISFDNYSKFEEYLISEGLERNLVLAKARGGSGGKMQEIYLRCAKTLIDGPKGESSSPDKVFGCPLELVPETNPYQTKDLKVRLLYKGKPLEGALVVAFNKSTPTEKIKLRTDRDGHAAIKVDKPGVWLVTSVHMIPAARFVRADWESFWASLTFEAGK
jgi:uncharacterized GH25 family protein